MEGLYHISRQINWESDREFFFISFLLRKSNRKREYIFGIFIHRTITCVVGTLNTTKGLLKVMFELSQQLKQMELDFLFTS